MDTNQLKEYLEIVVDMEKTIFQQKRAIDELSRRIKILEYTEPIYPPNKQTVIKETPKKPGCLTMAVGSIAGFMIAIYSVATINPLLVIVGTILGAFLAYTIVSYFLATENETGYQSQLQEAEQAYQEQLANYQQYYEQTIENGKKQAQQKAYWQQELELLIQQNQSSQLTLSRIYDADIIFPKYRNFIMVCSLYEYICAGRCTTLEGHEGAYNILEMEIRMDRI